MPSMGADRPAFLNGLDGLRVNIQRDERLQRRVAVGLGVGGIGFGLLFFALGTPWCCDQILVQVGQPAGGLRGGERLAVGADGRGKVGRIHDGQRLAFLDLSPSEPAAATPGRRTAPARLVAWSLSKSTVPVVSTVLWNLDAATV